jgi:hypothetical protein
VILDVGRGAPGVSLDAAIEGTSVLSSAPGGLSTTFQWLTLSARWRFSGPERLSVDLGLGLRGSRLTAVASGFTVDGSAVLVSVGPAATATLWVRVLGPVQLMFRASTSLRLPADRLDITTGPSFTIGAWQAAGVAGLAVAWP